MLRFHFISSMILALNFSNPTRIGLNLIIFRKNDLIANNIKRKGMELETKTKRLIEKTIKLKNKHLAADN